MSKKKVFIFITYTDVENFIELNIKKKILCPKFSVFLSGNIQKRRIKKYFRL